MQMPDGERCASCSLALLDIGEELVCPGCGAVTEKSVVEFGRGQVTKVPLFGSQRLGSFMGPRRISDRDRRSKVSGENTSYEKMKLMSDHSAREGSPADCGRLVERVGEKLFLPRVAVLQAAAIAKKMMLSPHPGRRLLVSEVSAYALVAACKVEGVTSVSIREILAAYEALGREVSSSAMFRLMFDSEVRTYARKPEDYLPKVIARLSTNGRLGERLARDGVQVAAYFNSLRTVATEILESCEDTELYGKRPCALAASVTYAAEALLAERESRKMRFTQRESSMCGDSAEYTVREQCATIFMPIVSRLASRRSQTRPPQNAR